MEVTFINAVIEFYQSYWNAIDIVILVAYTLFSAYTFVAEKPGKIRTIIALPGMIVFALFLWVAIKVDEAPTGRW